MHTARPRIAANRGRAPFALGQSSADRGKIRAGSEGGRMRIKAAVFDIDGTLVPRGQGSPSPAAVRALRALSQNGVAVIIATGRARYTAEPVLGKVRPDYFVAANGCDITDAAGSSIWSSRMTAEEMYALVDFCEDYSLPLEFVFSDAYHAYVGYDALAQKYRALGADQSLMHVLRDGEDQTRHLQDMPFSACAAMDAQDVQRFAQRYGHLGLRFLAFDNGWHDVLHADTDKAVGVGMLLERLGIAWAETAAFGDGCNDADLLQAAGFGVAMANGAPQLRALADLVAPAANEDGVARVVEEYLLSEDGF